MSCDYSLLNQVQNHGLNAETGEIYLHGYYIDDEQEPGIEYRMATNYVKNLHILKEKDVLVHMHTIGGNWHDGMGVYDAMTFSPNKITILGYASVSSMSTVILQAADSRVLMPNVEFMIHWGSVGVEGHSLVVQSNAEQNSKCNQRMLDIYTKKCAKGNFFKNNNKYKTPVSIKNFIRKNIDRKGDWYMTAEEAVDYGFADAVLGQKGYESIECLISKQ